MGIPPKWYGGKVVQQSDDGRRTIAYDDGDVREVLDTELEKLLAARPTALLKRANPADEGVIANVTVCVFVCVVCLCVYENVCVNMCVCV